MQECVFVRKRKRERERNCFYERGRDSKSHTLHVNEASSSSSSTVPRSHEAPFCRTPYLANTIFAAASAARGSVKSNYSLNSNLADLMKIE